MVNMAIDALLPYEVVPHFQRTLAVCTVEHSYLSLLQFAYRLTCFSQPLHETEDSRTADLHLGQRRRARARITAGLLEKYLNQRELRVLERRALRQAIVYENYRRQLAPPPPKPPLSPARPPTPDEKKHLHHHHHHLHPDLSAEKRHKPIPCVVSTSVIQDELETFLRAMLLEMQNTLGTILNLQVHSLLFISLVLLLVFSRSFVLLRIDLTTTTLTSALLCLRSPLWSMCANGV
jgi:hypothetical protein